jgi:hypothetical protein
MAELELVDWRRRVAALYGRVRDRRDDDPLAAHEDWRMTREELFRSHPETPLEDPSTFAGLAHAPYDAAFVWDVAVDTTVEHERFPVATSTGADIAFVRFGRVTLPMGTLDVFWLDSYGGGIFLPFRDAGAGDTTYGGGRYLLDTAKGADLGGSAVDRLTLDFNFAYHPSCYYAPQWSCPLAPPDNWLSAAIPVGEVMFSRV